MTQTPTRSMYLGTIEYLEVSLTADVQLDIQPVQFSWDRTTWHTAEWTGAAGTTRTARLLLGDTIPLPARTTTVYVRLDDNPEEPIMLAGVLRIA